MAKDKKEKKIDKISVRATQDGFSDGVRRRAGDVFFISPDIKGSWFYPVDADAAEAVRAADEEAALKKAEIKQKNIDAKVKADKDAAAAKAKADEEAKNATLNADIDAKKKRASASTKASKVAKKNAASEASEGDKELA